MSSSQQPPATHPATLRKTHQSVGVTEIMDGPKELRGRNFETDPVYGNVIWLVVSNIWIIFPFHIWDVILLIDELHHFSKWLKRTTNQIIIHHH